MNSTGSGSHPLPPACSGKAAVPSGVMGTVLLNLHFLPLKKKIKKKMQWNLLFYWLLYKAGHWEVFEQAVFPLSRKVQPYSSSRSLRWEGRYTAAVVPQSKMGHWLPVLVVSFMCKQEKQGMEQQYSSLQPCLLISSSGGLYAYD